MHYSQPGCSLISCTTVNFPILLHLILLRGQEQPSNNLGTSILGIIRPEDFLVYADVVILALVLLVPCYFGLICGTLRFAIAMTITALGFVLFGVNLGMAESNRSQLLTRTFDNNYIVKYLGVTSLHYL